MTFCSAPTLLAHKLPLFSVVMSQTGNTLRVANFMKSHKVRALRLAWRYMEDWNGFNNTHTHAVHKHVDGKIREWFLIVWLTCLFESHFLKISFFKILHYDVVSYKIMLVMDLASEQQETSCIKVFFDFPNMTSIHPLISCQCITSCEL